MASGTLSQTSADPETKKLRVMLVGHVLGDHVFGAERSLLDILAAIDPQTFDVSCVFPSGSNAAYLRTVERYTNDITFFPYHRWSRTRPFDQESVTQFEETFRSRAVDLLHVNTITLMDPLIAARCLRIPSIVHAREIVSHDTDLARLFDDDPRMIISKVKSACDFIIANSDVTHRLYRKEDRSFRMYNSVDVDRFDLHNNLHPGKLKIGLISSNLAKKGIEQFVELAVLASHSRPELEFFLIGPHNDLTNVLEQSIREKEPPANLHFPGYIADTVEAISLVNVVISLSTVPESFGRTIAEAMAARRPVIAYALGAVPELVRHGIEGFIIPPVDLAKVLEHLGRLADDPQLVAEMGSKGRQRALQLFSPGQFASQLNAIYGQILGLWKMQRPLTRTPVTHHGARTV
jgi:glycosyltransferase involved in cell wall biosynthesis